MIRNRGITNVSLSVTNSFTYTASADCWVIGAFLKLVASATVGNRQLRITVKDKAGNQVMLFDFGATQAAGGTHYYNAYPDAQNETAFSGACIDRRLPWELKLWDGWQLIIADSANVDATSDALTGLLQIGSL